MRQFKVFLISAAFFAWVPKSPSSAEATLPPSVNVPVTSRLTHSRELLGRFFALSGIHLTATQDTRVNGFVRSLLVQKMGEARGNRAFSAVLQAAKKHQMDPLFIVAIIENESRFNTRALGTSGEVGLMQIRPSTAAWVSKNFGTRYKNAQSLEDPGVNIAIGTQYIAYLRTRFKSESGKYVAAYNMGEGAVIKKYEAGIEPNTYRRSVLSIYSRYYSDFRNFVEDLDTMPKSSVAIARY